jgi:hypothetical protein
MALNASMGLQNIRILCVSCYPAHPQDKLFLRNINVAYYTPSVLQPLDLDITKCLKQYYRKYLTQKKCVLHGFRKGCQVKNQNVSQQSLGNKLHSPQLKTVFVSAAMGMNITQLTWTILWRMMHSITTGFISVIRTMSTSVHTHLLRVGLLHVAFPASMRGTCNQGLRKQRREDKHKTKSVQSFTEVYTTLETFKYLFYI